MLEVLRRVLHKQAIAGEDCYRWQFRKKQRLRALDLVDAQISLRFGQYFRQGLARREATLFHVQLCAENSRRRVSHRWRAVRQETRSNQPQEQKTHATNDRDRQHPLEHGELVHPHVMRNTDNEQVRRGTNCGRHAADYRRQPHGHHDAGYRELGAQGCPDKNRHEQHDNRRVVHKRAENSAGHQRRYQREHRPGRPGATNNIRQRLQRTGGFQRLANHHERADCDERLVAKTRKEIDRSDSNLTVLYVREQLKSRNQGYQDGK